MSNRKSFFHRTESKHWQEHSYRNPFAKKTHRVVWKKWLLLVGGGLVVILLMGCILFLPWFRFRSLAVEGARYVPSTDLEAFVQTNLSGRRWGIIPKDHRFFFSQQRLQEELLNAYPLNSVDFNITGDHLLIRVDERVSRFYWETTNGRFVVDEHGTVLFDAPPMPETTDVPPPEENALFIFPTISPFVPSPVTAGDTVLPETVVTHLLELLQQLKTSPLVYDQIEIDTSDYHLLRLHLVDDYSVFLDPTTEMISQLDRLITVLKGDATDPSRYDYIDVRFGERVYVKEKP